MRGVRRRCDRSATDSRSAARRASSRPARTLNASPTSAISSGPPGSTLRIQLALTPSVAASESSVTGRTTERPSQIGGEDGDGDDGNAQSQQHRPGHADPFAQLRRRHERPDDDRPFALDGIGQEHGHERLRPPSLRPPMPPLLACAILARSSNSVHQRSSSSRKTTLRPSGSPKHQIASTSLGDTPV